jgi:hypothetical protein
MTALGGVHVGWDVMKVTFAFDAARFADVLDGIVRGGAETTGDEPRWSIGIAQGEIEPVKSSESPMLASGVLWWGPPIVAASALANLARPGEILCARTVPAVRAGELVTTGLRIAREGTLRVRGARIESRQPWKKTAAANVARMTPPRLIRAHWPAVKTTPGSLVVVRADPGAGGTRLLMDLAVTAPRALVVSPVGSGFEPLGALRRALARVMARESHPLLLELSVPLEALLAGKGISLDAASKLITAALWPRQPGTESVLFVDDAKAVDPATLEACVRAVRGTASFSMVARLDATSGVPSVLAALPKAAEYEVPLLAREAGEAIAAGCMGGALDEEGRRRWARLGGGSPLAIVEAVTVGVARGDITWVWDRATPKSRASGRGKVRPAVKWIRLRANAESVPARAVLSMLAVLGGEARMSLLRRAVEKAGLRFDVAEAVAELDRARWLVFEEMATGLGSNAREPTVAFPSRTYHKALFVTLDDDARKKLHVAAARVLEEDDGVFGHAEGAWHAAQAGEGERAARALLDTARATAEARLEASTTQLIAFARRAHPGCEEAALELLANALERAPSYVPGPASNAPATVVEPAVVPPDGQAPIRPTPTIPSPVHEPRASEPPGSQIAVRLGEVAKEALLAADNAALERWVDGLQATGESPAFTDRMRAMARLGRGDIGDALRVLRRTREQLEPADNRRRCQTSLAIGVALSVAGRPQEALLEGLDALARARQDSDERGAKACLAFLAKLYTSVARDDDAERLRSAGA